MYVDDQLLFQAYNFFEKKIAKTQNKLKGALNEDTKSKLLKKLQYYKIALNYFPVNKNDIAVRLAAIKSGSEFGELDCYDMECVYPYIFLYVLNEKTGDILVRDKSCEPNNESFITNVHKVKIKGIDYV